MGINSHEKAYKKDSNLLYNDLLQLDTWRQQYTSQLAEQQAAYNAGKGYSQDIYETVTYNGAQEPRYYQVKTGTAFAPSRELQDLGKKIKALEKYDAKMPEAAKTRQAARELEATKARIAQRKADEAARRDELRRLRIGGQDVKTTQQGELGG